MVYSLINAIYKTEDTLDNLLFIFTSKSAWDYTWNNIRDFLDVFVF